MACVLGMPGPREHDSSVKHDVPGSEAENPHHQKVTNISYYGKSGWLSRSD